MRIHVFVNPQREDAVVAARQAIAFVRNHGVDVATDMDSSGLLGCDGVDKVSVGDADLVVTFGGDGTLIRAAALTSEFATPILGVYFGRFGFVTQCQPSEVGACLSEFFDGNACFEDRMMLQVELMRNGAPVAVLHALNEIALQRAVDARMMSFAVQVDDHFLTSYPADGIIVSTPTGTTAYNLSAGGPVIHPRLQAITLTAIAPHTLSARPLVLLPESRLILTVQTVGDAILSADSHTRLHLLSGDSVHVTRSARVTRLMVVDKNDFLIKLGERLLWSQSILGDRL